MSSDLSSKFEWKQIEAEISEAWLNGRAFHADPSVKGSPYCIVIPPPNVTAALHMGHALNNTLQDVVIRYHRMLGDNTVWIPGTDHAGIATQTVVEKRVLAEEGKRRTQFQRDEFVAKIQSWKDEYETRILGQLRAMGCSCDWDRTRFTMDAMCARAVREAFFRLFRDGLIYRGKRLVNWDPATQTALADDEVEMHDIDGHFWYLRYPLIEAVTIDGERVEHVTVATTRPETMLGDTAVAMNPRDPRAAALRGKRVILPIVNREIPIVEDEYVVLPDADSDDVKARYATGFLKVTPAHDPNDWEIGRRHALAVINVMAPDGSISRNHGWPGEEWAKGTHDEALENLLGMDRYEAREAIVEWFRQNHLLEEVKPYRHSVGHSYRSHVPVEPYLSDQWYVRVTDDRLAGAALRAMADDQHDTASEHASKRKKAGDTWEGQLRFFPPRYAKTFQTWHENIRDWCISRQLWWGHRIPVWMSASGGDENAEANARLAAWITDGCVAKHVSESTGTTYYCPSPDIEKNFAAFMESHGYVQDADVLDTWFSSALWPFSTLGWPTQTPELATWNPGNVLCTAREIITLWVSRMVMTNLYLLGRLPFRHVYIHAMIQDGEGRKMSKSLGNGIDPLDIIEQYGSDAMRYSLAYLTTGMQDIRMPVKKQKLDDGRQINTSERFDIGRNLCTKLWNASRLILMNVNVSDTAAPIAMDQLRREDRWILTQLNACIAAVTRCIDGYEFNEAATTLYRFFWNDLCDWYLELIKPRLYSEDTAVKRTVCQIAAYCLDRVLRLAHPFMPYITEKLWQNLSERAPSRGIDVLSQTQTMLVRAEWPKVNAAFDDATAVAQIAAIQEVIRILRDTQATINRVRSASNEKPIAKLPEAHIRVVGASESLIRDCSSTITQLGAVESLAINPSAFTMTGGFGRTVGDAATGVHIELSVPVAGLIDLAEAKKRLQTELAEAIKHVASSEARLANPKFVEKAPAAVIDEHRATLANLKQKVDVLQQSLKELA
jgi:valyl-tRNA synthetase